MGRLPYSRASFERVPHELGSLYLEHRADIEDALTAELDIPKEAASISVSLDRTTVPMEEPAKRPPGRPRKGAPKRPVTRQFRMAWCGTVTLHDAQGSALHTIRYGQMPNRDPHELCNAMANDVFRTREQQPDLKVALLADGAHEMWNLLEPHFPATVFGTVHREIDFWHLAEKLAAAAKVMTPDAAAAESLRCRWRKLLRRRKDAAAIILVELELSGCESIVVDSGRPVHEAITYLRNHGERMRPRTQRSLGRCDGQAHGYSTYRGQEARGLKPCVLLNARSTPGSPLRGSSPLGTWVQEPQVLSSAHRRVALPGPCDGHGARGHQRPGHGAVHRGMRQSGNAPTPRRQVHG
jgi:hypothetical protein